IGRARIVVGAHRRRARSARTFLAGLGAVAGIAVGAGGSVRNRHVIASARVRVARIGRARISVVAIDARTGLALAGAALARVIASAARRAGGAVGSVGVLAAGRCIAAIGGADVVVVALKRRAGHADAHPAGLGAVADVAVGARHAV